MFDCAHENTRRIQYEDSATFVPVCETCGRFVKADALLWTSAWAERRRRTIEKFKA